MTPILYLLAALALAAVIGSALFRRCAEWDAAEAAYITTQRKLATIREQQRSPKVVERNLAARLKAEMYRGRRSQVAEVYEELERPA